MNNNNNSAYNRALNIVNEFACNHKPSGCCCGRTITGPTGPTA